MSLYKLSRFSERLAWSTPQNAYSLLLEEKRKTGTPLLDLTISNPTEAFRDYPHREIARAYAEIASFHYEPAALGINSARESVVAWYREQGIPATVECIALTASTSEAYALLFKLLCDPGDEILIPCPSYPLFEYLARLESVKTVPYRLNYDGAWFIDFDHLKKSISARTKAIVMVNPNNPTGSFLRTQEVRELASLAQEHRLALIADEVFMTYPASGGTQPDQVRTLIGHNEVLSFSLNGLSKAAGMPQMKLGWIAVNGPMKVVGSTLAKLELLLDSYLSVSTPVQCALPALLHIGGQIRNKIDSRLCQNRQALGCFRNGPVEVLASEGGWSAILQVPNILTEDEWIDKLLDSDTVVVQPGYFYDMAKEAFLVVSLLTESGDFAQGIGRLQHSVVRWVTQF